MSDFKRRVYGTMDKAKDFLKEHGSLPSRLVGAGSGKPQIIDTTVVPKPALNILARAMARGHYALIAIHEMWWAEVGMDYDGPPPSKMDQRKEAILIEAKNRGGEHITLVQVFEHEMDGKIQWVGEVKEINMVRSRIMDGVYE